MAGSDLCRDRGRARRRCQSAGRSVAGNGGPEPVRPACGLIAQFAFGNGMVSAGLWAKKLKGRNVKPFHMVDITGQSSVCGT